MIRILVAMEREKEKLAKYVKHDIEVVGIGVTNLPNTTKNDIIINVGYCGGYDIPVGTIIEPHLCFDTKTRKKKRITSFMAFFDRVRCYTSDQFVEKPIVNFKSIYDMELYKLLELPHREFYSLKIVSDNLNEKDCEDFNEEGEWQYVADVINNFIELENLFTPINKSVNKRRIK